MSEVVESAEREAEVLTAHNNLIEGVIWALAEVSTADLLGIAERDETLNPDGRGWLARMIREYVSVWR